MPADKLRITLAGREQVVEAGTTAAGALDGQSAIAARVTRVGAGAGVAACRLLSYAEAVRLPPSFRCCGRHRSKKAG